MTTAELMHAVARELCRVADEADEGHVVAWQDLRLEATRLCARAEMIERGIDE